MQKQFRVPTNPASYTRGHVIDMDEAMALRWKQLNDMQSHTIEEQAEYARLRKQMALGILR